MPYFQQKLNRLMEKFNSNVKFLYCLLSIKGSGVKLVLMPVCLLHNYLSKRNSGYFIRLIQTPDIQPCIRLLSNIRIRLFHDWTRGSLICIRFNRIEYCLLGVSWRVYRPNWRRQHSSKENSMSSFLK